MSSLPLARLKFINQLPLEPSGEFRAGTFGCDRAITIPQPELAGSKARISGQETLYVIDRQGYRRRIPFPLAFVNLFKDSAFHGVRVHSSVADIAEGPSLDEDAILLRGAASEKIYLLDGGRKRLIGGRRVMEKYGFNEAAVMVVPQAVVNALFNGDDWD
jgi:hypothetical protein